MNLMELPGGLACDPWAVGDVDVVDVQAVSRMNVWTDVVTAGVLERNSMRRCRVWRIKSASAVWVGTTALLQKWVSERLRSVRTERTFGVNPADELTLGEMMSRQQTVNKLRKASVEIV